MTEAGWKLRLPFPSSESSNKQNTVQFHPCGLLCIIGGSHESIDVKAPQKVVIVLELPTLNVPPLFGLEWF